MPENIGVRGLAAAHRPPDAKLPKTLRNSVQEEQMGVEATEHDAMPQQKQIVKSSEADARNQACDRPLRKQLIPFCYQNNRLRHFKNAKKAISFTVCCKSLIPGRDSSVGRASD